MLFKLVATRAAMTDYFQNRLMQHLFYKFIVYRELVVLLTK